MISFRVESEALLAETKQLYPNSNKNYIGLLSTQEPDIQSAVGWPIRLVTLKNITGWSTGGRPRHFEFVLFTNKSTLFLLQNLPV